MVLAVSIIWLLLCCIPTLRINIFNYYVYGRFACMPASVPLAHQMQGRSQMLSDPLNCSYEIVSHHVGIGN